MIRLEQMCDRLNQLYASGEQPCLLAALIAGAPRADFHKRVKARLQLLVGAIATVLTEAGLDPKLAQQRGEDAVITIQGSLILSLGTDEPAPFQRVIAQLPQTLCAGI